MEKFPGGPVAKNRPVYAEWRGHVLKPWSRKIPHAARQLSLCTRTTESACLEPVLLNERSHRMWSPHTPGKSSPHSLQLDKDCTHSDDSVQPKIKAEEKMLKIKKICISQFSCSVVSNSLWPHGLQHPRLPCPSPTPGTYSNSCASSRWCHPTISSVIPFSSCLQSFPAPGSFQMS